MNSTVQFDAGARFGWLFNDFSALYSQSAMHRIRVEISDEGIQKLFELYPDKVVRAQRKWSSGMLVWERLLLRFGEKVFIGAWGAGVDDMEIFAEDDEGAQALLKEVKPHLDALKEKASPVFHMLSFDSSGMDTATADDLPDAIDEVERRLTYGADIDEWLDRFSETTSSRSGGFTLLDGPPGTGKTSLIMQLIRRLHNTHVFYALPVAQASAFAAAEFVPFWKEQHVLHKDKVKVIVLEDADGILQQGRRREGDTLLPSMLNVADGLAGRLLRLHVLCTVNCELASLEPALLRPGRLMQHRRIGLMSAEIASRLAAHRGLPWNPKEIKEEYSLAEVLNPESPAPNTPPRRLLGFHVMA